MKIFLLEPQENLGKDNAWEPWYDKAFGFVIVANNEIEARKIANESGGDETGDRRCLVYRTGGNPWLDPKQSKCIELKAENYKEGEMILRDFASA